MNVVALDRQITIEYPAKTTDPVYGTQIVTWAPLITRGAPPLPVKFWAEVVDIPPSRSEAVSQGLTMARNQTRIRMRWRGDITSDMRVIVHRESDVTMQIIGGPAEIFGRKAFLEVLCEAYSS